MGGRNIQMVVSILSVILPPVRLLLTGMGTRQLGPQSQEEHREVGKTAVWGGRGRTTLSGVRKCLFVVS